MADETVSKHYHDQVVWERDHYKHLYETIVYGPMIANYSSNVDQEMLDLVKKVPLRRIQNG